MCVCVCYIVQDSIDTLKSLPANFRSWVSSLHLFRYGLTWFIFLCLIVHTMVLDCFLVVQVIHRFWILLSFLWEVIIYQLNFWLVKTGLKCLLKCLVFFYGFIVIHLFLVVEDGNGGEIPTSFYLLRQPLLPTWNLPWTYVLQGSAKDLGRTLPLRLWSCFCGCHILWTPLHSPGMWLQQTVPWLPQSPVSVTVLAGL